MGNAICHVVWYGCGVFGAASAVIDQVSWMVRGRGIHSGQGKV